MRVHDVAHNSKEQRAQTDRKSEAESYEVGEPKMSFSVGVASEPHCGARAQTEDGKYQAKAFHARR
ncbi:MAG: hypothetical protein HOG19_09255 [Gammaproteobacteria bacterium]|nr:hypothetical protein [Gammaproteobacteria bacterium]